MGYAAAPRGGIDSVLRALREQKLSKGSNVDGFGSTDNGLPSAAFARPSFCSALNPETNAFLGGLAESCMSYQLPSNPDGIFRSELRPAVADLRHVLVVMFEPRTFVSHWPTSPPPKAELTNRAHLLT